MWDDADGSVVMEVMMVMFEAVMVTITMEGKVSMIMTMASHSPKNELP